MKICDRCYPVTCQPARHTLSFDNLEHFDLCQDCLDLIRQHITPLAPPEPVVYPIASKRGVRPPELARKP